MKDRIASIALAIAGIAGVAYSLELVGCIASVQASPAEAPLQVPAGVDPTAVAAWVGAISGVLALVVVVLTIVYGILKIVAPWTPTKIDDEVRDGVGEILAHLRGQAAAASSPTTVVVAQAPAPPRDPQAGLARPFLLVVLVGLFAGAGMGFGVVTLSSCATARARGGAAGGALLDCQAHNLVAAIAELVPLAKQAVMVAIGGTGHVDTGQLRAAAAPLKSDLGRCALAAAIAALASPPPPEQPGAPAAAPLEVDGHELRAAFVAIRGELGWPTVKAPDGTVL